MGGAAFILLSAGPATNSVTMGVVLQTLGKKALFIYLGVIGIFSVFFGFLLDLYFPNLLNGQILSSSESFSIPHQVFAIVMLMLMIKFLVRR